jgi:hypothetical protein
MCTELEAPESFHRASEEKRGEVSNGCGPQSALFNSIPTSMRNFFFGLDVGCACDIHDWMYEEGKDQAEADVVFYRNMRRIIEREGGWLKQPRLLLAWWYYRAVRRFGHDSFAGK